MLYNNQVTPVWSFLDSTSVEALNERITDIPYTGQIFGTLTGTALAVVASNTLTTANGNRRNVPDIAFVLTDGRAQDNPEQTADVNMLVFLDIQQQQGLFQSFVIIHSHTKIMYKIHHWKGKCKQTLWSSSQAITPKTSLGKPLLYLSSDRF